MQGVWVQSLDWEIISHMSHGMVKIFFKRRFQVYFVFFSHLSALLSFVLASLSGRFSHEKQDGGHQFSYPQTGHHRSGLGQGQSLTQLLRPEIDLLSPAFISGDRNGLQLLNHKGFPKGKRFVLFPAGRGHWRQGGENSVYCSGWHFCSGSAIWQGRKFTHWILLSRKEDFFFSKMNKASKSVLIKQTAYSSLENICKEPDVIDFS